MEISTIINNPDRFERDLFSNFEIGVEIQSFGQHTLDDGYDDLIAVWQKKLSNYDHPVSLHGSSFDLHPGSADSKIVEVTKYRYLQSIDIARQIDAKHVIFHSQINPLLSVEKIRTMKLNNQIEFWNNLFEKDVPSDISILIENEYDDTYDDIKRMCDEVNYPNFGVCLDVGHALAYSSITLEEWFLNLGDRIKYIHLHWNDGKSDAHDKPSNEELIVLKGLLDKYELTPIVTLEYQSKNIVEEVERVKRIMD